MNEKITLQEITEDSLEAILELRVTKEQEKLVDSNAVSIAKAHFSHDAWFRGIYADDTPVGFVMLSLDPKKPAYYLWRMMIDHRFQHKGYGKAAITEVVEFLRTLPNAKELLAGFVPDDSSAESFYLSLGFEHTGLEENGEKVLSLPLT